MKLFLLFQEVTSSNDLSEFLKQSDKYPITFGYIVQSQNACAEFPFLRTRFYLLLITSLVSMEPEQGHYQEDSIPIGGLCLVLLRSPWLSIQTSEKVHHPSGVWEAEKALLKDDRWSRWSPEHWQSPSWGKELPLVTTTSAVCCACRALWSVCRTNCCHSFDAWQFCIGLYCLEQSGESS